MSESIAATVDEILAQINVKEKIGDDGESPKVRLPP
jgi:hypothetical protein